MNQQPLQGPQRGSNDNLFSFILDEVYAQGGDGDAAVLFKIQNPNNVTEDFERYMKNTGRQLDWRRGGTNTFYSTNGQECIAFFSATTKCDGPYTSVGVETSLNANWRQWDIFVVTF